MKGLQISPVSGESLAPASGQSKVPRNRLEHSRGQDKLYLIASYCTFRHHLLAAFEVSEIDSLFDIVKTYRVLSCNL
jgi:hypothetical protein